MQLTRLFFFLFVFSIGYNMAAQKMVYYPNLDKRYKGGSNQFGVIINSRTQYPKEAKDSAKQGKAVVAFVLAADGKIKDARVVNNIGFGMDKEALRVFELTYGQWIPDSLNHLAIDKYFEIPISFRLVNEDNTKELEKKAHKAHHDHDYKSELKALHDLCNMHPYKIDYLMQKAKANLKLNQKAEACADFKRVSFLKSHAADDYLKQCE